MKLLLGSRYSNLTNRRRCLWSVLFSSSLVTAALILMLMITTDLKKKFSAERTWLFGSFFPTIHPLDCEPLWCVLDFISTFGDLRYSMLGSNCTLVSLISFGMMFTLTSYLVLLSLKLKRFNRQRFARYHRVSSSLWTRRKVY